jgi:chemotaxis signal transduction protein
MSEKKRKAPKRAPRDLQKGGAEMPASSLASPETPAPRSTPAVPAAAVREESAPVPPAAPPIVADGREAEVHRILDKLATHLPSPRTAPASAPATEPVPGVAPTTRGPVVEDDVVPFVAPSELRDAARARHGRAELLLFRAGGELFALPLGAVEEAIEGPEISALPEMPAAMLGVFRLRERLVPTYSPADALGVALRLPAGAALLVRSGERRIALAADDVEDVMELDLATLREPPVLEDGDGILLGVARFARDLVGVLDADALIAACLGGRTVEIS